MVCLLENHLRVGLPVRDSWLLPGLLPLSRVLGLGRDLSDDFDAGRRRE